MRYISTRGTAPVLSFEAAMLTGLARDGGLYVPESLPRMNTAEIAGLAGKSYEEAAFQIMRPFIAREALDRHLAVAGDFVNPKAPFSKKKRILSPDS